MNKAIWDNIEPNITLMKSKELGRLILDVSDDDWCLILTGLSHFNRESQGIKDLITQIQNIREVCGPINNERVGKYQEQYFALKTEEAQK